MHLLHTKKQKIVTTRNVRGKVVSKRRAACRARDSEAQDGTEYLMGDNSP